MTSRAAIGALLLGLTLLVTGCDSSDDIIIPPEFSPGPTAVDDAYAGLGNAPLDVTAAQGVRANDFHNGATVTAFDAVSAQGGTVVVNPDGSFTYTPAPGFTGADTFNYTITNVNGQSTATVTITVGNLTYFVDNSGPNGDGTLANPFNNINDALNAVPPGQIIFVFAGDGTQNGLNTPVVLADGQQLIGEGSGLMVDNGILPREEVRAQQIVAPNGFPNLLGPVTLGDGNLVSGIRLDGSPASAIMGNGILDTTLTNNQINAPGGHGIELVDANGQLTIDGNVISEVPATRDFIHTENSGTDIAMLDIVNNTLTDTAGSDPVDGASLTTSGQAQLTVLFDNNSTDSPAAAMSMDDGLFILAQDTSTVDVTVSNNTLEDTQDDGVDIRAQDGSQVTVTSQDNTARGNGDAGFMVRAGEPGMADTATLDFTSLGDSATDVDSGIVVSSRGSATATGNVTGGTATNASGIGFVADSDDMGSTTATFTDCTATTCFRGFGTLSETSGQSQTGFNNCLADTSTRDGFINQALDASMIVADIDNCTADSSGATAAPGICYTTNGTSMATGSIVNGTTVTNGFSNGIELFAIDDARTDVTVADSFVNGNAGFGIYPSSSQQALTIGIILNNDLTGNTSDSIRAETYTAGCRVCLDIEGNLGNLLRFINFAGTLDVEERDLLALLNNLSLAPSFTGVVNNAADGTCASL